LLRKVLLAGKILFVMKEKKKFFYGPSAQVTTSKEEINNSFSPSSPALVGHSKVNGATVLHGSMDTSRWPKGL
jgi:hypothetical protein